MIQILLFVISIFIMIGLGLLSLGHNKNQTTHLEHCVVSLGLGYVIWSLTIYITAWIGIRSAGFILMMAASCYSWFKYARTVIVKTSLNFALLALILLGSAGQLFLVFNSGSVSNEGMVFYGVNSHDGMWHAALMNTLQQKFPPMVPTFSNITLSGYHYMVDLSGSELVSMFRLSPFWLTFRLLPGLFSVLTGLAAYAVMKRLKKTELASLVTVFLIYFGGSFSFVLQILGLNKNPGESAFWSQQSITTFINLPLGISFGLIAILMLLLLLWLQNHNDRFIWLSALIVGMMVSIKAYGGLITCVGFGVFMLYELIKQKRIQLLAPLLLAATITALLVFPHLQSGKSTFLWEPGWFLRTMMEAPDKVNYVLWEQLRQVYSIHHNIIRLIEYWGIAFVVFVIGNAGIRMFGLITLLSRKTYQIKQHVSFNLLLWLMIVLGFTIPTFLIQTGVVWNSIQFVYYSLFLMSFVAGMAIDIFQKKLAYLMTLVIVLLSIPSNLYTISSYVKKYVSRDAELISSQQIEALNFVRSLPKGTVISPYYETAFIPALSGHATYFSDETQSSILLIDSTERATNLRRIFVECRDEPEVLNILYEGKVDYVYLDKNTSNPCTSKYNSFTSWSKLFSNEEITIYEVN